MAGEHRSGPEALERLAGSFRPEFARIAWAQRRLGGDRTLELVDRLAREGDVVLDIGANWGLFTARLAQLVGPRGHVHAFEPNPEPRMRLEQIAGRESNVTVHPVALSDQTGEAELHVPVLDGTAVSALGSLGELRERSHFETISVPLATLDECVGTETPIAFVKCDVEGHELSVLRGGETVLSRSRPSLLVEIEQRHSPSPVDETFRHLERLGYRGWSVTATGLKPLSDFDVERDQLAHLGPSFNDSDPPAGYLNDFFFAAVEVDVDGLLPPS